MEFGVEALPSQSLDLRSEFRTRIFASILRGWWHPRLPGDGGKPIFSCAVTMLLPGEGWEGSFVLVIASSGLISNPELRW